ncbi:MAG: hypothetical protein DMG76_23915 [Acidobacteria bacterium]|nr:MAG: hypothetical protein DMG76_23915 [Acidobacteriota bacterium]
MRRFAVFAGLLAMAVAEGCGAGTATPVISVSLSQATFTVFPQATTQFTATVSIDSSGKGVTWTMTCNGGHTSAPD